MTSHDEHLPPFPVRFAEAVLPGHPDKLADQVADALVELAMREDDRAIVQVEVAVHDHRCHINGRIATLNGPLSRSVVEQVVRDVYARVGFGVPFPGVGDGTDYQCPHPDQVVVDLACALEASDPAERDLRELCDDQSITVGYAIGTPETNWLPMEQHLALSLRDALLALTQRERALGAGPDGKVLVALRQLPSVRAGYARWEPAWVVTSVQHLAAASVVALERAVRACLMERLRAESARMPELLASPGAGFVVRVNEAGPFVAGGPMNDNGQTGRKTVMDFYGPHVAVGGGALSGKDPWRVDRVGAVRAREMAVDLVRRGVGREVRVTLVWGPRDREASGVVVEVEGRVVGPESLAEWFAPIDLGLVSTAPDISDTETGLLEPTDWRTATRTNQRGR